MGTRTLTALVMAGLLAASLLGNPPTTHLAGRTARVIEVPRASVLVPGVNASRIKIGLHAPLTGASPVPSDSVDKGKDLFFRWLEAKGRSIDGRDVTVVLRNDQYNPSAAVSVCKQMVEKERVFALVGMKGPDQMQACARYAASVGVPYISPGTTELVLNQLDNYFATTMTDRAQGRLLADFFIDRLDAKTKKNGILDYDSPNWTQVHDGFVNRMERRGAEVHYQRRVSRTAGQAEARLVVEEMKAAGIQNVVVHITPIWFLNILEEADAQGFEPTWSGVGNNVTHDVVTQVGCNPERSLHGARFFSPYPAVAESDRFDERFPNAVQRFHPGTKPDDFMWQLWAMDRVLAKMLDLSGPDPTRRRFIRRVERAERIRTGIGPTLRYRPDDHLGARSTYVLRADCDDRRWHTTGPLKASFSG